MDAKDVTCPTLLVFLRRASSGSDGPQFEPESMKAMLGVDGLFWSRAAAFFWCNALLFYQLEAHMRILYVSLMRRVYKRKTCAKTWLTKCFSGGSGGANPAFNGRCANFDGPYDGNMLMLVRSNHCVHFCDNK